MPAYRRGFTVFDNRLMNAVSPRQSRVLDQVLPGLGRAANHSRLWIALAGAMAATPRRTTRRAALRGLASVTLASASANLVGKSLVRRKRPVLEIPLVRQLRRTPSSSSFPSGHAASAAAFATGVALENPYLALPVAALAAGVAASRVVTGVHYPTDVVAGAALGVSAGLLTTRWWPALTPEAALAPPPAHQVPATATGKGLVLVVNAAARSGGQQVADRIQQELPDAEVLLAEDGADLPDLLEQAAGRARVLGVAGGDGTVGAAAAIALRRGLPLLVIPAGTLNHFARDLGVENIDDALTALREGEAIALDVGTVEDRVFINTFSVGAYVDLVAARERHEHTLGKWPAVLAGAFSVLRTGRPVRCVIDGTERRVWLLFAGNCLYQPLGLAPSQRRRLDDGNLDIRIVDAAKPLARARLLAALATGTLATSRVYQYHYAPAITLRAVDAPLEYCVDGERVGQSDELSIGKAQRALIVYRPARNAPTP